MKLFSDNPKKGGVQEMLFVAFPMVLSMSFDTFLVFINRMFLSKLGSDYMNAALIGGVMEMVTLMFFTGTVGYSTAMVAQNLGAKKTARCPLVLVQACVVALCSYPIVLLLMPVAHAFLGAFDVPQEQSILQVKYFDILIYGSIISLLRHAFACFFIGIGKTKVVMTATIVGFSVTLFFSYALIFGKFGLPALDIIGAPLSVIAGSLASFCVLLAKFFSREYREKFSTNKCWRFSPRILSTLIKKGLPAGSEMFLNMLAFQALILVFDSQGTIAATATTIMFNWDMVSFVPLIGFEIGVTSLVGKYIGARDFASAHRATHSGLKIGVFYSAVIILFFVGLPELLVNIFAPYAPGPEWTESKKIAITMVRLAAIYVTVESVMVIYAGALRGAGDTLAVMCIMSGLHWLLPVMAWVCFNIFNMNVVHAWAFQVAGFMLFPLFLYMRWRSGKWRKAWENGTTK